MNTSIYVYTKEYLVNSCGNEICFSMGNVGCRSSGH